MLNYIGPNDGEGIRIYYDGTEVVRDTDKSAWSYPAEDGRIVLRRQYTDQDRLYSSIQVDELIFFNEKLNSNDIDTLFKL